MSATSSTHRRALWLTIGLFGIVAVGLFFLLTFLDTRPRFEVSPDGERPWEEATWRKRFDPAAYLPLPKLSSDPPPVLTITEKTSELEIVGSPGHNGTLDAYYEIFEADPSGVVTLTDGNQLELAAVALLLPSDIERNEATPRYPRIRPVWIDPRTGDPIPADLPGNDWAQSENQVPAHNPRLFLRVRRTGSQAPLRWHAPQVHDDRTLSNASGNASYSHEQTHGHFWVDLEQWHQAPLRIGIPFAFGAPEEKTIPAKEGAVATFGDEGRIELLDILPHGHGGSSWGGDAGSFVTTFQTSKPGSGQPERTFLFQVWPRPNHYLTEIFPAGAKRGRLLTGNYGISAMEFRGEEAAANEIRIRRYPRLGRAVFELSSVPRLPEVTNLFKVPIPWIRIDYSSQLGRAITDPTGTQHRFRDYQQLPESLFPMEFSDTTPEELITEYEGLTGQWLYFNEETLELTDERPPGLSERVKDWWKRHRPSWFP